MKRTKPTYSGFLVFFLVIALAVPDISPAGMAFYAPPSVLPQTPGISIPSEFGRVLDAFVSSKPHAAQPVIFIQDAHAVDSVQHQISKLLSYLQKNRNKLNVFLEGAVGRVDPSFWAFSEHTDVNESFVRYLVDSGDIGGAEAFGALLSDKSAARFQGIEEPSLYLKQMEAFKKTTLYLDRGASKALKHLQDNFDRLAEVYLNENIKEVLKFSEKFERNTIEIGEYADELYGSARKHGLYERSVEFYLHFPQFSKLREMISHERKIDNSLLKKESEQVEALLEKTHDYLESGFIAEGIKARTFYHNLEKQLKGKGVTIDRFPQFQIWADFIILKDDLDASALMSEAELLEKELLERLVQSEKELRILYLRKRIKLLDSLIAMQLTSYLDNSTFQKLNVDRLQDALDSLDRHKKHTASVFSKLLQSTKRSAEDFYKLAAQREESFVQSIEQGIRKSPEDLPILIAGGFHTKGVCDRLQKKNISYILVQPKASDINDTGLYHRLMRRQLDLEISTNQHLMALPVSSASDRYLGNNRPFASRLLEIEETANALLQNRDPRAKRWSARALSFPAFQNPSPAGLGFGAADALSPGQAAVFSANDWEAIENNRTIGDFLNSGITVRNAQVTAEAEDRPQLIENASPFLDQIGDELTRRGGHAQGLGTFDRFLEKLEDLGLTSYRDMLGYIVNGARDVIAKRRMMFGEHFPTPSAHVTAKDARTGFVQKFFFINYALKDRIAHLVGGQKSVPPELMKQINLLVAKSALFEAAQILYEGQADSVDGKIFASIVETIFVTAFREDFQQMLGSPEIMSAFDPGSVDFVEKTLSYERLVQVLNEPFRTSPELEKIVGDKLRLLIGADQSVKMAVPSSIGLQMIFNGVLQRTRDVRLLPYADKGDWPFIVRGDALSRTPNRPARPHIFKGGSILKASDNTLFVLDRKTKRVLALDPRSITLNESYFNKGIWELGSGSKPVSFEIHNQTMYVLDAGNRILRRYVLLENSNREGKPLALKEQSAADEQAETSPSDPILGSAKGLTITGNTIFISIKKGILPVDLEDGVKFRKFTHPDLTKPLSVVSNRKYLVVASDNSIVVFDSESYAYVRTIRDDHLGTPLEFALDPDHTDVLYVSSLGKDEILKFDLSSGQKTEAISDERLPTAPSGLLVKEGVLFVTSGKQDKIGRYGLKDIETNVSFMTISDRVIPGLWPRVAPDEIVNVELIDREIEGEEQQAILSPKGFIPHRNGLFVLDHSGARIMAFTPEGIMDKTLLHEGILSEKRSYNAAVMWHGRLLLATGGDEGSLSFIDITTGDPSDPPIEVPHAVDMDVKGDKLYVIIGRPYDKSKGAQNSILVIDLLTRKKLKEFTYSGRNDLFGKITISGNRIYVATDSQKIIELTRFQGTPIKTIDLKDSVDEISDINFQYGKIYAVDAHLGNVVEVDPDTGKAEVVVEGFPGVVDSFIVNNALWLISKAEGAIYQIGAGELPAFKPRLNHFNLAPARFQGFYPEPSMMYQARHEVKILLALTEQLEAVTGAGPDISREGLTIIQAILAQAMETLSHPNVHFDDEALERTHNRLMRWYEKVVLPPQNTETVVLQAFLSHFGRLRKVLKARIDLLTTIRRIRRAHPELSGVSVPTVFEMINALHKKTPADIYTFLTETVLSDSFAGLPAGEREKIAPNLRVRLSDEIIENLLLAFSEVMTREVASIGDIKLFDVVQVKPNAGESAETLIVTNIITAKYEVSVRTFGREESEEKIVPIDQITHRYDFSYLLFSEKFLTLNTEAGFGYSATIDLRSLTQKLENPDIEDSLTLTGRRTDLTQLARSDFSENDGVVVGTAALLSRNRTYDDALNLIRGISHRPATDVETALAALAQARRDSFEILSNRRDSIRRAMQQALAKSDPVLASLFMDEQPDFGLSIVASSTLDRSEIEFLAIRLFLNPNSILFVQEVNSHAFIPLGAEAITELREKSAFYGVLDRVRVFKDDGRPIAKQLNDLLHKDAMKDIFIRSAVQGQLNLLKQHTTMVGTHAELTDRNWIPGVFELLSERDARRLVKAMQILESLSAFHIASRGGLAHANYEIRSQLMRQGHRYSLRPDAVDFANRLGVLMTALNEISQAA